MKLQHLAILFILIIVPISLVMASYIQNQIDAIAIQTAYDKNLISATYDAVKAFQLNTTNNKYSSISDSKIRDIEASVNTFYNSLNSSMLEYAQRAKDLEAYVPAMLFTLYDGYYVYTSYDNVYSTEGEDEKVQINIDGSNYQNGLKPYVYYSAKYKLKNGNIIVVNYTLDNEITIYGDVGNGEGYVTKSGYLINPEYVQNINETNKTLTYNGIQIGPEVLTEHLITLKTENNRTSAEEGDYRYIFYDNEKIYQDHDSAGNLLYYQDGTPVIFWYHDYTKTYVQDEEIRNAAKECGMQSDSAYKYYKEAQEFSEWVNKNLKDVTQANTIRIDGDGTTTVGEYTGEDKYYLSEDTGDAHIFETSKENDPLVSDSVFNNHRLAVIRKTVETTLNSIISNYTSSSSYDYAMPVISNSDWYTILNNVSMVTFLQGMSIGYRIYNNYAIITNNINKEVVKTENIYVIAEDKNTKNREYHQPGCKELLEGVEKGELEVIGAYPTASFQRQSVRMSDNSEEDLHYYLQEIGEKTITGCYNCIVNATANYNVDDIIKGNDLIDFANSAENGGNNQIAFSKNNNAYKTVRKTYLTALARERYDIYKSNFDLEITR